MLPFGKQKEILIFLTTTDPEECRPMPALFIAQGETTASAPWLDCSNPRANVGVAERTDMSTAAIACLAAATLVGDLMPGLAQQKTAVNVSSPTATPIKHLVVIFD